MKTRVYLCGPISNIPDGNRPAFYAAEQQLERLGYEVVNPHKLCANTVHEHVGTERELWLKCMKRDIPAMLSCDVVALLPTWQASKGATLERNLACALDIPVKYLDQLIPESIV